MNNIKAILINEELSYCQDYNEFKLIGERVGDKLYNHIINNKGVYKTVLFSLALMLQANIINAETVDKFEQLEVNIFEIGCKVMRVVCVGGFFYDAIKSVFQDSDIKGASKALMKYGTIYACVYLIVWTLDLIEKSLG